jgi:hypothetical protein
VLVRAISPNAHCRPLLSKACHAVSLPVQVVGRPHPAMSRENKNWAPFEDEAIRVAGGGDESTFDLIADTIGRSSNAVRSRYYKLNAMRATM